MRPVRLLAIAAGLFCLVVQTTPACAEQLGRLFLTPERRAALERQRQFNIQETQQKVIEGATLSVSGIVRRSSGKTTAWINDTPQDEAGAASGVRVEVDRSHPGSATLIAGEESPATLKVGETINRATRETTGGLGEGRIVIKDGAGAR